MSTMTDPYTGCPTTQLGLFLDRRPGCCWRTRNDPERARDPFAVQLDWGLDAEAERSGPEGGRRVNGGESWLRRYSAAEPVPGRVLWPGGRVVRDDERQRILLGPQARAFLALEEVAWEASEDRVWLGG